MKTCLIFILLSLATTYAYAQSSMCGSTTTVLITGDTNCPFGGFKIDIPAISQSASTVYSCNTPQSYFVDNNSTPILGLVLEGASDAIYYWHNDSFWRINPATGLYWTAIVPTNALLYAASDCSGQPFIGPNDGFYNRVNPGIDGSGATGLYKPAASYSHASANCYRYSGGSCGLQTFNCSGAKVYVISAGTSPDLTTSYTMPIRRLFK